MSNAGKPGHRWEMRLLKASLITRCSGGGQGGENKLSTLGGKKKVLKALLKQKMQAILQKVVKTKEMYLHEQCFLIQF